MAPDKEVAAQPRKSRERIVEAVERLRDDPRQGKILSAEWRGFRRLRTLVSACELRFVVVDLDQPGNEYFKELCQKKPS